MCKRSTRSISLLILFLVLPCLASSSGFLDAPIYPSDADPLWVTTADFNHDNHPDIAAASTGSSGGSVSVFLNNGDGTFAAPVDYPVGGAIGAVLFITEADLNADGNADLLVIDLAGISNRFLYILLGNGDGTFQPAKLIEAGAQPDYVAAGDFNRDGNLDLVVTNLLSDGTVSILLGNGDGTFQLPVAYAAGGSPMAVAVGDFNGDDNLDLVTVHNATACIFMGNGDGTFEKTTDYAVGAEPLSVAVVDLNKDGILDLAVANSQESDISVLLGNGDGTFQSQTTVDLGVGMQASSVAIGDFNQDGNLDLAAGAADLRLLLGNGDGTFQPPRGYAVEGISFAVADFDGDGNLDIVSNNTGNLPTGAISVLFGNGDGTLRDASDFLAGYGIFSLAVGDFNGDGKQDVVTANILDTRAEIALLPGQGDGSFGKAVTFAVPAGSVWLAVADFNLDRNLDVVVAGSIGLSVLLGNGNGTFQPPVTSPANPVNSSLLVGDFNGDGKPDVAVLDSSALGHVAILLGTGSATLQPLVIYPAGFTPVSMASGDFDGNGKLDLVVSNQSGNVIWLGNGDGTFQEAATYSGGYGSIITADFNLDGKPDLAIADNSNNTVAVLLGNGDGTFQAAVNYTVSEPLFLAALDVNGDGKPDLAATGSHNSAVSILLGNGDGTLQAAVSYAVTSPTNLAVGDFNGDHSVDLVVSGTFNVVTSLLNTGGAKVTTTSSANPSHLGQSVTFTTTVAPTFSFIGPPTGTITFKDGTTTLGKVALSGGQASLTTSALALGKHKITAVYSGDANFNPNQAAALRQRVIR
jgi:hypothetical protein